jgi:pimeloyl-ACP methyl ester carboxylesterase
VGAPITEREVEVAGIRILCREVAGAGPPAIFVHGNPTQSADWVPFLERMNGPAIAFDLPGFGRSERPDPARFDHSLWAYADVLEELCDLLAPGGYRLVTHDWGVLGLIAAQRHPPRLERLVAINTVPLSASYRWHWVARIWRRRGLGEAFNAVNSEAGTAAMLRLARPGRKPMPPGFAEMVWSGWDAGMRRAVLGLYRSADPEALEAAGERLGELACPALVVWGTADPYIGAEHGRALAAALPRAELIEDGGAGHWPWIDRPELIERVVGFLSE